MAIADVADQLLALAQADLELVIDPDVGAPGRRAGAARRRHLAAHDDRVVAFHSARHHARRRSGLVGGGVTPKRCPASASGVCGLRRSMTRWRIWLRTSRVCSSALVVSGHRGGKLCFEWLQAGLDELGGVLQKVVELCDALGQLARARC